MDGVAIKEGKREPSELTSRRYPLLYKRLEQGEKTLDITDIIHVVGIIYFVPQKEKKGGGHVKLQL